MSYVGGFARACTRSYVSGWREPGRRECHSYRRHAMGIRSQYFQWPPDDVLRLRRVSVLEAGESGRSFESTISSSYLQCEINFKAVLARPHTQVLEFPRIACYRST